MYTGASLCFGAVGPALRKKVVFTLGPEIRANVVAPAMVTGRWHLEHLGAEKYEAQMTAFANSTPLRQRVRVNVGVLVGFGKSFQDPRWHQPIDGNALCR